MIYCGKCGKASPAGTKFCGGCGAPLTVVEEVKAPVVEPTPVVEQPTYQEAKCWKIFGRVGFGLSIATLVCAVTFVFSYLALALSTILVIACTICAAGAAGATKCASDAIKTVAAIVRF